MARRQADYKRPGPNDSVVLKRYLGRLAQAASFFDQYFRNKVVTYVTAEKNIILYFSATNFMHLCGSDYQKGAASFFDEVIGQHVCLTSSSRYLYL